MCEKCKNLVHTIQDIRKIGIDEPSLMDIYRMSGTYNN